MQREANMVENRRKSPPRFIASLGEGRAALEQVTSAVQTGSMSECVKQVFLQIEREMKRKGVERFGVGDITITERPTP